jgi:hypothetical protein
MGPVNKQHVLKHGEINGTLYESIGFVRDSDGIDYAGGLF